MGLRNHVIQCGDLTDNLDSLIILEDDLFVSPNFYHFSVQALNFYCNDSRIAGISLYSYRLNENIYLPFLPLNDGYDVFFMQVPCSWGQVLNKSMWKGFKAYYSNNPTILESDKLPNVVKTWPETSWKKYIYKYMILNDLYFVYPQNSYSVNSGDAGQHFSINTNNFQVPLHNGLSQEVIKFVDLDNSSVIYDAYYELMINCLLRYGAKISKSTIIDLYGTKQFDLFEEEMMLSIKKCLKPIVSFGLQMHPVINNVLFENYGQLLSYGKKIDFLDEPVRKEDIIANTYTYFYEFAQQVVKHSREYRVGYILLHLLSTFLRAKGKIINKLLNKNLVRS